MPTVLLTGAAGYIGSHVAFRLRELGEEVLVLDNLSSGHRETLKGARLVVGDIGDEALVREILTTHHVQDVVHLAAMVSVPESVARPQLCYETNLVKSIRLLETCLGCGVKTFLFSSTAAVYGNPSKIPVTEDSPLDPISPYGRSKLAFEWVLEDYAKTSGLHALCLRYFNAAGLEPRVGDYRAERAHLIPVILEVAAGKRKVLEVFGTDYPTRDGTAIRDYFDVRDIAEAHVRALQLLRKSAPPCRAINLGAGQGLTVFEVVAAAQEVTGREIPIKPSPRRPGDPVALVADISRARELLDWQPSYSSIASIIRSCWEWEMRPQRG